MTDDRDALLAAWVDELCAALGLEQPPEPGLHWDRVG